MDPQTIQLAVLYLISLIASICVHEFGHAYVADRLGDPTPRGMGRVTLNPAAHIDPVGTLLLPLVSFVMMASGGAGAIVGSRIIGWGKPVEWMPSRVRRGMTMKTAELLVSIAGPAMNILFALLLSVVYVAIARSGNGVFAMPIRNIIGMNIGLAFFNLIPVPPLDGRSVLFWFLPSRHPVVEFLNAYGQFIFFALLITGSLSWLMLPAYLVSDAWLTTLSGWTAG